MSFADLKNRNSLPLGEEQKPLDAERDFFSPENRQESVKKREDEKKEAQLENERRASTLFTSVDLGTIPVYGFQKARRCFMVH